MQLKSQAGRLFYFDAARALFMLLGVPYHVARIYGSDRSNPVESLDKSPFLHVLAEFLHSFRMEGFFAIAGFFTLFVYFKMQNPKLWLESRFERILIPLISCTLLFGPINTYMMEMSVAGHVTMDGYLARLSRPGQNWVLHLWFLQVLLVLVLLLAAALWAIRSFPALREAVAGLGRVLGSATRLPLLFGLAGLSVAAFALWITPAVLERTLGVDMTPFGAFFGLARVIQFAPFFLVGLLMVAKPELLDWFLQPSRLTLPVAVAFSLMFVAAGLRPQLEILAPVAACGAGIFWLHAVLTSARKHLDRHNAVIAWLCDASFSIYLFHLPIALALGLAFRALDWPPVLEFALVLTLTLFLSCLVHLVIRRSPLLSLLFNGKRMHRRKPQNAAA